MPRSLSNLATRVSILATVRNVLTDGLKQATGDVNLVVNPSWSSGTGSFQADRAWQYEGTLAAGASQVIDLYDFGTLDSGTGAGKDILGQSINLSEIVALAIQNASTPTDSSDSLSPGDLEIVPDSTAGWNPVGSHTQATGGSLTPGGLLLKVDPDTGFVVNDGSSHRIKLTANGGEVNYRILVIGRS